MPLQLALAGSARWRGGMPPIRDLIALPTVFRSSGTSPSLASSALRGGWDGVAAVEQPENEWHKSIRRRCRLQHKPDGEEDRSAALRFVDPRGVGWNGSLCSERTTRSHMIFFRSKDPSLTRCLVSSAAPAPGRLDRQNDPDLYLASSPHRSKPHLQFRRPLVLLRLHNRLEIHHCLAK